MHVDEYQDQAGATAIYPDSGEQTLAAISYVALGLVGEAGEVANIVKKMLRDGLSVEEAREHLIGELGDCLWYLARICSELDLDLSEVAAENLGKLLDRQTRGVLSGSGDHR